MPRAGGLSVFILWKVVNNMTNVIKVATDCKEIREQIRKDNKTASMWLIHYRERKRDHEERRREIAAGTKREHDENVGGGRASEPGRPTEDMALALEAHDNSDSARWLQTVEAVLKIIGIKKRQLVELRQECRYYISPDGGRPGWVAPVQQRFGEITGWCPSDDKIKEMWYDVVCLAIRIANIKKCKF